MYTIFFGFILFFIMILIYFLSKVCIQFNYLNNINLRLGMDINKLYADDNKNKYSLYDCFESIIKNCALFLYKSVNHIK